MRYLRRIYDQHCMAGCALRLASITSLHNCTFTENMTENGEGAAAVSNVGSVSSMFGGPFVDNAFTCRPEEFLDYLKMQTVSGVPTCQYMGAFYPYETIDMGSWILNVSSVRMICAWIP